MNEEKQILDGENAAELIEEISKKPKKDGSVHFFFDMIEMFAWSVFVVLLIFSFAVRLCRVEGGSMENTLYNGENLLIYSLGYTPKQDDIIVFHLTQPEDNLEKTIVKRVIATEGQHIEINFNDKTIYVNGKLYEDSHMVLKDDSGNMVERYYSEAFYNYNRYTRTFSATVPEGHVFVLGDNRNHSLDSRYTSVGFVDERCILGKVIVRISPFTTFF